MEYSIKKWYETNCLHTNPIIALIFSQPNFMFAFKFYMQSFNKQVPTLIFHNNTSSRTPKFNYDFFA